LQSQRGGRYEKREPEQRNRKRQVDATSEASSTGREILQEGFRKGNGRKPVSRFGSCA